MKKATLLFLFICFSTSSLFAGNGILGLFNIGVKGGYVASSEIIPTKTLDELIKGRGDGYFVSAILKVPIPKTPIYIQTELQYSFSKYTLEDIIDEIIGQRDGVKKIKMLDLPVLVGAQLDLKILKLKIEAGPVFNLADDKKLSDLEGEDLKFWKSSVVTWAAGVGVEALGFVTLDLRYNGNFDGNKTSVNGVNLTSRTSWSLGLGILF